MKSSKVVCNFAIVRFLPYPETEEFVNLGVVVACPSQQYFDFRLENIKRDRVTGFFPELNADVLIKGRHLFQTELERVREGLKEKSGRQDEFAFSNEEFSRLFCEVVKPRESLFRYSSIGIRLAETPAEALDYLYGHYVDRMFEKKHNAASEICRKFVENGAVVLPADAVERITSFAQAV